MSAETITTPDLAAVLEALSVEMSLAAEACGHLDSALGKILENTPPESRLAVMQELHTVDHLAQHITAITDFTSKLVQAAPDGVPLPVQEALSTITLGAVAERLRGRLGL
ncbi:hypothetical protein [Caulobacter endophyticus]|uniref:hypothetical protein n=1 Tax=Caulobacter endophyticus TaxID=2172652 RepID=UPI00240F5136|nr:hypothetical protein [Caulobacter endophyticus]MDG2530358.1 hypothetical protein [Caulobacter endophyticus]